MKIIDKKKCHICLEETTHVFCSRACELVHLFRGFTLTVNEAKRHAWHFTKDEVIKNKGNEHVI